MLRKGNQGAIISFPTIKTRGNLIKIIVSAIVKISGFMVLYGVRDAAIVNLRRDILWSPREIASNLL